MKFLIICVTNIFDGLSHGEILIGPNRANVPADHIHHEIRDIGMDRAMIAKDLEMIMKTKGRTKVSQSSTRSKEINTIDDVKDLDTWLMECGHNINSILSNFM